ncbi:MAG: GNAT family N-acetyltransferase [Lachnospiraceae bacterium]|nr:GNAT family N-acetyltransferase [Lachnospiraceae bacterium]
MKIRQATSNDIKSVADIYNDIHTLEEAGSLSIGWIRDVYPTDETARQALQKGELFVEEDDDKIVGAAIINQQQVDAYQDGKWQCDASDSEVMVLHTLVISPQESGKGYGRSFVDFYEQYALEHNCHYLRMDTNAKNSQARAMYKKLGYNEIGIVPCVFNGIEGVQLVLLEKLIPFECK